MSCGGHLYSYVPYAVRSTYKKLRFYVPLYGVLGMPMQDSALRTIRSPVHGVL